MAITCRVSDGRLSSPLGNGQRQGPQGPQKRLSHNAANQGKGQQDKACSSHSATRSVPLIRNPPCVTCRRDVAGRSLVANTAKVLLPHGPIDHALWWTCSSG